MTVPLLVLIVVLMVLLLPVAGFLLVTGSKREDWVSLLMVLAISAGSFVVGKWHARSNPIQWGGEKAVKSGK